MTCPTASTKATPTFFQSALSKLREVAPPVAKATTFVTTAGTITSNSLLLGLPLWSMGAIKALTGSQVADKSVLKMANYWIRTNNHLINKLLPQIDLRVSMPDSVSENGKYILLSNHQSWVDTTLIQYISDKRLPLTRFFTKHELLYIPVVGQAFYFLDFPMMKRYSKEAIAKNPALKTRDIEEAKRACHLLMGKPFTLLNFIEGTRFTPQKHAKQKSPYQHLLKPKAGGVALALGALGDKVDGVLDMTIVYPDGIPTYQDLWQGNIRRIGVDIRPIEVPKDLLDRLLAGRFSDDAQTKADVYEWLDQLWQQKDQRMQTMLAEFNN
ncbi:MULTISPECIES: acyltransferase [unclassified Moraxella]|uniref:acyltransferase n=1 Tax=unclassified Moraxella TaxID=2685852 RepID=UPI003AF82746